MVSSIQPNTIARILSIQPHDISLSKESVDYLNDPSNLSILLKPVEIIKLDDVTYFCENGNHRLYCLAKKGYDECPARLYDINNAEDRLILAQNRRERRKNKLLIDTLSEDAKAYFDKITPPAKASDFGQQEIKEIRDTIDFVRSMGIYVITDLEGKFLPTRHEIDTEFNIKYREYGWR